MPKAYIIARRAISYRRYITRARRERISLKQLREMLGGISEGTALKLMQENKIKHYKVKYQYRIPKKWVIDYIMSDEYEEYCKLLRHKIER